MTELGYKTLRESIVDIIRKRIINRELQPGQKIVEQELAKEFHQSCADQRGTARTGERRPGRICKKCRMFCERDHIRRII